MAADRALYNPESPVVAGQVRDAFIRLASNFWCALKSWNFWRTPDQSKVNASPQMEAQILRNFAIKAVRSDLNKDKTDFSETVDQFEDRRRKQWKEADASFQNLRLHVHTIFDEKNEAYRRAVNDVLDKRFCKFGAPYMVLDNTGLHVHNYDIDEFRPDGSASRNHYYRSGEGEFEEFGALPSRAEFVVS
jgi:hypothetical protein